MATGADEEVMPVLLSMVDPVIWGDEERMKRELMAWAKAVASMALNVSPAPPPTPTRRTKCAA
jgi:hypothetical protein